jgi:hypothetical protein
MGRRGASFSPVALADQFACAVHLLGQAAGLGDDQMDEAAFISTAYRYDIALGPHDYDKSS